MCPLQEEVSELKSLCARLQRDSEPALSSEVSWTQLQSRLQSFVDSPPHQLPSTGDPPGAGGVSRVEASTYAVSTGKTQERHQLSVGVSCEGGTPFSNAAVFVVPQRRGRRPGRGRGGRRGGATRGGRRGGRGRQQNPPTHQLSKTLVVGNGDLVNLDMLGVLGLLGSDCAGPSGGVTREELRRAEEEESPLPSVPSESSASAEERHSVDGTTVSGGPGTQEEGGADEGGFKNDKCDGRNEGNKRNDKGDRSSVEGDESNDKGDIKNDEGDRSNDDDKKSDEGDRQNDEDDKKSDEADRWNDEVDRRSDEGDRGNDNEDYKKGDNGDSQNDENVGKSDKADRQNNEVDSRNDEDDKIAEEDASKADQGDSSVGDGGRSDEGNAEDRKDSDGKTVLMADSVGVAQELPVGEQHEEMVVTLSATATPPVGGRDPRTAALSKLEAGSGVSEESVCGEVRCEPPVSKPGKRRGRPPKDDSKRKKTEDSSEDVENGTIAHVDQSGSAAATLDTCCEEVGGEPAPSQKGRRRKTISKLQSSFLPDVPASAQVSHRTRPAVGVASQLA